MNLTKHFSFIAVMVLFSFFIRSSSVYAYGDDETARNTLHDIGTIGIVVDWDAKGIVEEKITAVKEKAKKDIVQTLIQEGIKVRSGGGIDKPPFLYVAIHSFKSSKKTHAVYFDAKVFQKVNLKKDQSISSIAPTWSSGGLVGIVAEESFLDVIAKLVDEFISAYLSVNPKDRKKGDKSARNQNI